MKHSRHRNRSSQLGASLIEFSVLVALISVICVISTLILFFFSTCLLMVSIKRIALGWLSNLGFLANHFGLYIALNAGVFGSGDLIRYTMELKENKIAWVANDANNKAVVMPIAVVLEDFVMDEFAPKLAIINHKGDLLTKKGKNLFLVKKGRQFMCPSVLGHALPHFSVKSLNAFA